MTSAHPEGVTKFSVEHGDCSLDRKLGELTCSLIAWREILALTGLVGSDPQRYEGAGFGNCSVRIGRPSLGLGRRAFLITGTQTGSKRCLDLDDFAVVERYDSRGNQVQSYGRTRPSSESLTHGATYDLGPHIRCVFHAHSPVLWRHRQNLRLAVTDPRVPYGTPEMAAEVQRLFRSGNFSEHRILAMGGHEDGILAFGRQPEEVGANLLKWLARAYESECGIGGVSICPG